MKPFESFFASQLDDFIIHRQSQRYVIKAFRSHLLIFDRYLKGKGADESNLQPSFFLEMRASLKMQPSSINVILSVTRTFFQFMVRLGYYRENPLRDIPQLKKNTIVPFVFDREQTDQLLGAIYLSFQ